MKKLLLSVLIVWFYCVAAFPQYQESQIISSQTLDSLETTTGDYSFIGSRNQTPSIYSIQVTGTKVSGTANWDAYLMGSNDGTSFVYLDTATNNTNATATVGFKSSSLNDVFMYKTLRVYVVADTFGQQTTFNAYLFKRDLKYIYSGK